MFFLKYKPFFYRLITEVGTGKFVFPTPYRNTLCLSLVSNAVVKE